MKFILFKRLILLIGLQFSLGKPANAGSIQSLVVEGQILRSDGTALEIPGVIFTAAIKDSTNTCTLYSETFTKDLSNSKGFFNLELSSGTRIDGNTYNFSQIFVNSGSLSVSGCGTFSPASANEDRILVITFNDGSTTTTLSSQNIKSVPYAQQASQIAGYGISNLLKISGAGSTTLLSPMAVDFLSNLSAPATSSATPCSSGDVLKFSAGAWICAPGAGSIGLTSLNAQTNSSQTFSTATFGLAPSFISVSGVHTLNLPFASTASVTAGLLSNSDYTSFKNKLSGTSTFSGDVSGTSSAISVERLKGSAISVTTPTEGNYLRYNGSAWVNANLSKDDMTGTLAVDSGGTGTSSLAANKVLIANSTGSAISSLSCTSGQWVGFDASGFAACKSLSTTGAFINGGNSFGSDATLGPSDSKNMFLLTNNLPRLSILSDGKIGIKTTSPTRDLEVGDTSSDGSIGIKGSNSAELNLENSLTTSRTFALLNSSGILYLKNKTDSSATSAFSIRNSNNNDIFIVNFAAPSASLVIANNGKIGVNNSSPNALLHVGNSDLTSGSAVAKFQNSDGTCTLTPASSGSGLACSSDERLKENFENVNGNFALDKISKIQAVTYNFKTTSPQNRRTGYKAQDLSMIAPEFVRKDDDGFLQVYYDGLIPWITEAIKVMYSHLNDLEAENKSLRNENTEIKERIKKLESQIEKFTQSK